MSVRVQSRVWEHSAATGNSLLLLLKIADCCDDEGRNAWPSIAKLARYCRCSESTVKRGIRELVELGELRVTVQAGGTKPGTRYAPNLYRVLIKGGQIDTPQLSPGVSISGLRGVKTGDSGGSPVTPNSSRDPSKNADPAKKTVDAAAQFKMLRGLLKPNGASDDATSSAMTDQGDSL